MSPAETADPSPDDASSPSADRIGDDVFATAGEALDAAGVRWCRLRPRDGGSEDDLLVTAHDLAAAVRALRGSGWRERRQPGHGSHRAFLRYDAEADRWWKLDLVTTIDAGRWQEWRTGLAAGCLERRTASADGPVPSDDDAFWTLLLHELLDRPGSPIRRGDRLRATAITARPDSPGALVTAGLAGSAWPPSEILAAARAGEDDRLLELGRAMARGLGRRPSARLRRATTRVVRWLDHLDPPFVRRGRTIALLGPDGAGKSTLATMIGRGGPIPVRTAYLGLYGGSRGRRGAGGASMGARIPGIGFASRLLAMWRGWVIGAWHASRGRVVIFDRHPLDARLAPSGTASAGGGPGGRLRRAILGHALPAPDVVIVLDAPADVLVARKAEHPVERIADQRDRYLALAARHGRAVVVDATAPLDEVARRTTALAWEGRPPGPGAR